jgi:membrane protein implicated in regulation of membrane protease activity
MVNVEIGLAMVVIGIGFLIAETMHPGFFIAVPGTVLIVMGAILILLPAVFDQWSAVIMVITALVAGIGTIVMYHKIAPGQKPSATSMDTLIGKRGIVIHDIESSSIIGKVKINNQIWSATSDSTILAGTKVEVIRSEGVHLMVTEIKD